MSDVWKAAVHALMTESGHYKFVVEKIESLEPVVPVFDYKSQSNIEEIKFKLAQKEMWKLILTVLKGNLG
jgi:hypothetical protein